MTNELEPVISELIEAAKEIADTDSEFNACDDFYDFVNVMWSDDDRKRYGLTSVEYNDVMHSVWHRRNQWSFPPSHYLETNYETEVIDRAIEADKEDGVKPGPRSAYLAYLRNP